MSNKTNENISLPKVTKEMLEKETCGNSKCDNYCGDGNCADNAQSYCTEFICGFELTNIGKRGGAKI